MQVLLRELAPLTVGVVMLGRSGLVHLTELSTMRDDGTVRVLEAEGIDPALLLAMPRILALGIATFCHALLFTLVTVGLGYAGGALLGLTVRPPVEFAFALVRDLGATGVLVLPLKTFLIGLVIGAVVSATALHPSPRGRALVLPHGFFRALIALALVSALVSVIL
jgi:phospholipid/cholesterol/gamma-HCH transport system permease protein